MPSTTPPPPPLGLDTTASNGLRRPTVAKDDPPASPLSPPPYWAKIVSGSMGSILTALAVTPLDVVKVRQQQQSTSPSMVKHHRFTSSSAGVCSQMRKLCSSAAGSAACCETPFVYWNNNAWTQRSMPMVLEQSPLGTIPMLRRIFHVEGFRGLYAGLVPTLVMGVPNTVLYYVSYDEFMGRYRQWKTTDSFDLYVPAVGGGLSRLLSSLMTAPLELIRTRQAAANASSRSMWQELVHVIESDAGVRGLYRGLSPTLWRDVPFSAMYWFTLERLRGMDEQQMQLLSPWQQTGRSFVHASIAGMVAAACTTPMDVLKTRRQVEESTTSSSSSTASRLIHIVRTEGVTALWRGNVTRMIKVAPACAIMLSSYELGKRVLGGEDSVV